LRPDSRVKTALAPKGVRRSWWRGNGAESLVLAGGKTLRGRSDFEWLFQSCRCSVKNGAHGAEGRHPRRGAPNSGAGVAVEEGASRLRVRWSRAGRLAITECIEVESTEAGDGENPRPLDVSLATRMASERAQKARDWEHAGRRTDSTMHERASSPPSQRSEDHAVTVRGRAAPDDASTALFDGT